MASFGDAIRYPMEREDWYKPIAIGGILSFLGFLLLPLFVVYGYIVRVVRETIAGEPEPPAFEDWGALLVEGFQAWLVGLIYMIIPLVVMFVTVGGAVVAMATGTRAGAAAGIGGLFGGLALSGVLSLVFGYFAVVALVNFAREERFGAAFDLEVLRQVGLDGDYFVAWLLSVVVLVVVGIVVGMLNVIPVLGWLVGAFLYFYGGVVAARLWGDGFQAAVS